jgi:sugar lactone lactonase YvrE
MNSFHEIGIPVRGVNWVRLHPGTGADGAASLIGSMGQNNGGLMVIDIDLDTGKCRQFNSPAPGADYPISAVRSLRTGQLWLGTAWDGHLHRFDPARPERGLEDLGAIDPGHATFPTGIQEDGDGMIWIGAYPGCCLTRFDPRTGEFTRFGRLDETDKYLYPLCGDDGTIAAQTKTTRYRLIAFDRKTGAHVPVGPVLDEPNNPTRRFRFFKACDGLLYLDSDQGKFRLEGMAALPVDTVPPEMPGIHATYRHGYQVDVTMPGGWRAAYLEENGAPRQLTLTNTNSAIQRRHLTLDWVGGGTQIFMIGLGPDRRIYGSSILPEHIFRCETDGTGLVNLGQCNLALGEAYSMTGYGDGLIAFASYPAARISLYDPRLPWRFGTGPGSNPLDIGPLDAAEISYRPHAMTATPDGRLWIGGAPNYGIRGGPLGWYDPGTATRGLARVVVPDTSPNCLLWIPELQQLLVGLGTEPGSGVSVQRPDGAFALWDTQANTLVHAGDYGLRNLAEVCSLVPAGRDGLVYALSARPTYLIKDYGAQPAPMQVALIDPAARRVVAVAEVPASFGPLPEFSADSLRRSANGAIYLVLARGVCRVDPATCTAEPVWELPDGRIDVTGPVVGQRLFFATQWRLRYVDLPLT